MTEEIEFDKIDLEDIRKTLVGEGQLREPGRPRGTGFRRLDRPFHEKMRELYEGGFVPSLTAAAWKVVEHAAGGGTEASKVDRLVRTYPF